VKREKEKKVSSRFVFPESVISFQSRKKNNKVTLLLISLTVKQQEKFLLK